MHKEIDVVYENGVLRPLDPLPAEIQEHQRLKVRIDAQDGIAERLDSTWVAAAERDADPTVSLEEVRRILARVPGSLAAAAVAERDER